MSGRANLPGQLELASTEKRPGELAKLKAAAPMRAAVAQDACDVGLFGDGARQSDLVDLLR